MTNQHGTFLEHLGATDWVLLLVVCLSAFWGMFRGFSKESGALLVWVGSFFFVVRCGGAVIELFGRLVAPSVRESGLFIWGGRVVLFIVVLIVLNLITSQLARVARQVLSGALDTLLGAGFGVLRGYVILVLLFCAGGFLAQDWLETAIKGSVFAPYVVRGVEIFQGYIPVSWSEHLAFMSSNSH